MYTYNIEETDDIERNKSSFENKKSKVLNKKIEKYTIFL